VAAGTQIEVVRVAEQDLGAAGDEIAVRDALDGALRADRHERGRLHDAVRRPQLAAARRAVGVRDVEGEHRPSPVYSSQSTDGGPVLLTVNCESWTRQVCAVRKLRVGVIYGGRSGEHEVSLASAAAVFQNLDPEKYETVAIRIEKDGRWALPRRAPAVMKASDVIRTKAELSDGSREAHLVAHPGGETFITIDRRDDRTVVSGLGLDVVFPVLHGPYGEDGTVQGLLELANVPYVGAGVLASAVGMDKAVMKLVFAAKGLSICDYDVVLKRDWQRDERAVMNRLVSKLGFPMFVKPANLGSSVGISKAKHAT